MQSKAFFVVFKTQLFNNHTILKHYRHNSYKLKKYVLMKRN